MNHCERLSIAGRRSSPCSSRRRRPIEQDRALRALASYLGRQLKELLRRDQATRLHLEEVLHGQPWIAEVDVIPITRRRRHADWPVVTRHTRHGKGRETDTFQCVTGRKERD